MGEERVIQPPPGPFKTVTRILPRPRNHLPAPGKTSRQLSPCPGCLVQRVAFKRSLLCSPSLSSCRFLYLPASCRFIRVPTTASDGTVCFSGRFDWGSEACLTRFPVPPPPSPARRRCLVSCILACCVLCWASKCASVVPRKVWCVRPSIKVSPVS